MDLFVKILVFLIQEQALIKDHGGVRLSGNVEADR